MLRILFSNIFLSLLTVVSACSDSPETDSTESSGNSSVVAGSVEELFGTWQTDCSTDGEGTGYRYSEWTFSATDIIVSNFVYDATDSGCTSPTETLTGTYAATYLSDRQSTSLGPAIKTDMIITESIFTDESGPVWNSNVDGIPADITDQYLIFLIDGGLLYGPSLDSGDGIAPESRPTEIDATNGLTRKQQSQ